MFKIVFDGYMDDDKYDTYEEAEEAAYTMVDEFNAGASNLYNSNPGDYLEEAGDETCDFEIIEVEDEDKDDED